MLSRFRKKTASRRPLRALPLRIGLFVLMFLAVVMIGARLQDIFWQIAHGQTPTAFTALKAAEATAATTPDAAKPAETPKADAPAPVVDKPTAPAPDAKAAPAADAAKTAEAKPADKPAEVAPPALPVPGATPTTAPLPTAGEAKPAAAPAAPAADAAADTSGGDAAPDEEDLTQSEINVLKHLSERRKELDKKSREIEQRQTLLNLTEQRVDKKVAELKDMQESIRKVLGEADAQHKAQVASMVKIYETMKAKDAARIFQDMDMPTRVEVVSRMKEAKAAPVLAAMDAAKAKDLSTQLMTRKNLPAAP